MFCRARCWLLLLRYALRVRVVKRALVALCASRSGMARLLWSKAAVASVCASETHQQRANKAVHPIPTASLVVPPHSGFRRRVSLVVRLSISR